MPLSHLYSVFPNLAQSHAEIKSPVTFSYNCIAWAAGDTTRPWWPRQSGYYWPHGVRDDTSVEAFIEAFQTLGYEPCEGDAPEAGYEKVAIYVYNHNVKHVARLLLNNLWSSKLGEDYDIEHELEDLMSNHSRGYGEVVQILKRPR